MNPEHEALWRRLKAFEPDDADSPLTFTRRLARENRWTLEHARRVVEEYKRFAFLAVAAGHPVTPSDAVDQAWHLHLIYTRSYWDEFCGRVLQTSLHHGPTRGGASESAKYHDWYGKTLDSYARLLGEPPPADVWPAPEDRFGRDLRFVRTNAATHWFIPRPDYHLRRISRVAATRARAIAGRLIRPRRLAVAVVAALAVAIGMGGCVGPGGVGDLSMMTGGQFLMFFLPLSLLGLIGSGVLRIVLQRGVVVRSGYDPDLDDPAKPVAKPGKLDAYEAALLINGASRNSLTNVALVKLAARGAIRISPGRPRHIELNPDRPEGRLDPIEAVVVDAALAGPEKLSRIREAVGRSPQADAVEAALVKCGWVIPRGGAAYVRILPALLLGILVALGAWRIRLGWERERPTMHLQVATGTLAFAAVMHLVLRPWRTRLGDEVAAGLQPDVPGDDRAAYPAAIAHAFAILGVTALPSTAPFDEVRACFPNPNTPGGGCGAHCGGGGGDGGGGCGGGGCGGCGGCGG